MFCDRSRQTSVPTDAAVLVKMLTLTRLYGGNEGYQGERFCGSGTYNTSLQPLRQLSPRGCTGGYSDYDISVLNGKPHSNVNAEW